MHVPGVRHVNLCSTGVTYHGRIGRSETPPPDNSVYAQWVGGVTLVVLPLDRCWEFEEGEEPAPDVALLPAFKVGSSE